MSAKLESLLEKVAELQASDLHLIVGVPPAFRVNGEIILADDGVLTASEATHFADILLSAKQQEIFEREWEICISLMHAAAGRMRVTLYRRNGAPEFSIRFCGEEILSREELGLPAAIDELARKPTGLVLITGPTGSGKTTTLNYMVDLINRERRCKIVTIEDPIEHSHRNKRALVVQQEVSTDTHSFGRALMHALRQDPDVIVVGEMRDHAAISTALTAAETGHLVLATLHSPTAAHAVERIVGVYEGNAQRQVIMQLASTLHGIVAQDLLPSADRSRRVLGFELLIANAAVRNTIREGKLHQLENCIQMGSREGMVLMDDCLYDLYTRCEITYDTGMSRQRSADGFSQRVKAGGRGDRLKAELRTFGTG